MTLDQFLDHFDLRLRSTVTILGYQIESHFELVIPDELRDCPIDVVDDHTLAIACDWVEELGADCSHVRRILIDLDWIAWPD